MSDQSEDSNKISLNNFVPPTKDNEIVIDDNAIFMQERHKQHKKLCLQILQFASSTRLKLLVRSPNSFCQIIQNLFCCFKADASIGNALSVGELR